MIAKLTADYAKTGQGREADANRAATQLARREAYIQAAEGEVLTASANLCRLLNLDPSIRLHPTDAFVVPHPIVPDPIPVAELIALGLLNRPELGRAASGHPGSPHESGRGENPAVLADDLGRLQRGRLRRRQQPRPADLRRDERREPISTPSCTGRSRTWGWQRRPDPPGGCAAQDHRSSSRSKSSIECVPTSPKPMPEPTPVMLRSALMKTPSDRVTSPIMKTLIGPCLMGATDPRDVLPIELLNSFDLLANARVEYVDAIVDYNRAQFAMYVALGQPPANALAHPVPVEGVVPRNVPAPRTVPAGGPAAGDRPSAASPAAAPPPSRWRQRIRRVFQHHEMEATAIPPARFASVTSAALK